MLVQVAFALAVVIAGAPLQPPSAAPSVEFKDIDGKKGASKQLDGWVIVYSFADRGSSDPLMEWRERTSLPVLQRYPQLKIANINFADLTAVPSFARHIVNPILRNINARATKKQKEQYAKRGIKVDSSHARFHLVPDYKGEYLELFGLSDAEKWHCWVVKDGRVVATFVQGESNLDERYLATFAAFATDSTEKPR